MHRWKLGLAALALFVTPWTARAQVDLTGSWIVSVEAPQGKMDLDTTIKHEGEKISGQVTSPMGSVDFTGTFIKNELSILYSVPVQGQVIDIRMTGTAAGDTLSGAVDLGGLMQAAWSARRKPVSTAAPAVAAAAVPVAAAPAAPGSVSGKWNITVQMGPNALPLTGTLVQDGQQVSGSITTPFGSLPVAGTMVGTALTLQFSAQTPQGPLNVTMNGTLGAAGLSGKSVIAGLGESDWSATRVVE